MWYTTAAAEEEEVTSTKTSTEYLLLRTVRFSRLLTPGTHHPLCTGQSAVKNKNKSSPRRKNKNVRIYCCINYEEVGAGLFPIIIFPTRFLFFLFFPVFSLHWVLLLLDNMIICTAVHITLGFEFQGRVSTNSGFVANNICLFVLLREANALYIQQYKF